MGRNRKFVLEDDLQQAVWQTILRGPRPPSAKWGRMRSSMSTASKPSPQQEPQKKTPAKPPPVSPPPPVRREALSPDEAVAAARRRVVKLEAVLETLGEEDETYPTILAALK